jgi:hypothetical protein
VTLFLIFFLCAIGDCLIYFFLVMLLRIDCAHELSKWHRISRAADVSLDNEWTAKDGEEVTEQEQQDEAELSLDDSDVYKDGETQEQGV